MDKFYAGIFSTVASLLGWLLGDWDISLQILVTFMVMDFTTGVLKSFYLGELSSRRGYKGLFKKCGIMLVISISALLDTLTGVALFRIPVVYFFIAIEGISILENLGKMGVPIPEILLNKLAQLKEKSSIDPEKIEKQRKQD